MALVRALFLDRDGVINVDHGYVHRREDFQFVPGIFELARLARRLGLRIVVVTNQAGIGRGLYSEADFAMLTRWMCGQFEQAGATIDRVYHCPTHPTAGLGAYRVDSPLRKPHPGMLFAARDELGLDLAQSALLGDKGSDIEAGRAAGLTRLLFLNHSADAEPPPGPDVTTVANLGEAGERLCALYAGNEGGPAEAAGYTYRP